MVPIYKVLRHGVLIGMGGLLISQASAQVTITPVNADSDAQVTSQTATKAETAPARLSDADITRMLDQAEAAANRTASLKGIRTTEDQKRSGKFHIFIVDRNGKVKGKRSMDDAWTGSIDIALGKARTAAFFSSNENAFSSRQIGMLSQAHGADGTGPAGGLWGIGNTNQGTGTTANLQPDAGGVQRNSIVTFPGGLPLYKDGILVGGIGVSGDNVDQDESVAFAGAEGYMPSDDVGTISPLEPKKVDMMPEK